MEREKKYIFSLDEIKGEHLSLVGSKFFNLSQLHQKGCLVPPAFCLSQRAWEVFLQRAGLGDLFEDFCKAFQKGETHQLLFQKATTLSRKIETFSLPLEIEEEVRYIWERLLKPLAIRSSALEEDLDLASFAGIHTSFLNVGDLKEALKKIRDCWRSMFSEYSLFYRLKQSGKEDQTFGMGVILQEMVPPVYSGVLFTFNPVLGRQEIMVEIQEGEEIQENFTLCREEFKVLERRSLAKKKLSLPPKFLRNLGKLGLKLEEMLGAPQDIEWVYRDEKIYLLQSRPITSLPGKDEKIYWTAANSQEVLWKPVTPLTFSFFAPLIEKGRAHLFQTLGIENHFEGEEYLRLFYGRPYFNINYFNKFLQKLDISRTDLFDTLIFGQEIQMEAPLPRISFSRKVVKLFWQIFKTRLQGATRLKTFCRWFPKHCTLPPFTTLPPRDKPQEVLQFIKRNARIMEEALHMHVLGSALAGAYFFALGKVLHLLKIHPNSESWTALASGIPGIHSALEGRSLLKLARIARKHPAVEYLLLTEKEEKAFHRILPKVPGGNRFLRKMDEFLEEFGHRSLMEADLSVPRRKENSSFLFKTLQKYLEMDSLEDREEKNIHRRIQMSREVLKKVSQSWKDRLFPWKQLLLGHLMKSLVTFMPYRENFKDMALKPLFHIRQGFLRLEEHFIEKGLLETQGDIFFLDHEEVLLLAQGSSIPNLREKIEKAKRSSAQGHSFLAPQLIVVGREGEEKHSSLEKGKVLVGLGCSPGIITGKARVVVDNQQVHSLQPGEILVTRTADPAMTPLFLLAQAVIMDVGGALSHSVVVAREYGIPCVTALREGTRRIHTGDTITVDGSKGLVYLE